MLTSQAGYLNSELSVRVQFCKLDAHSLSLFTFRKSVARTQFRKYGALVPFLIIYCFSTIKKSTVITVFVQFFWFVYIQMLQHFHSVPPLILYEFLKYFLFYQRKL